MTNVVLLSEGKLNSFSSGSTKWLRIVAQGNFYLQQWAREPGVDWNSLYNPELTITTVTATNTFNLPTTVRKLSKQEDDPVRITHLTAGQYTDYDLVRPELIRAYDTGFYVAQIGRTLRFNHTFATTDPQFGGTIKAPAYLYPDTFSLDADTVDCDDPNYLVYMVAADRVKNDVTRKDLRADLIDQANQAMEAMKADNDAQITTPLTSWNPTRHTESDWWVE